MLRSCHQKGDDKTSESDSVGNQRRLIEDFAAQHPDIQLVAEKVDDGYSGVLFDRPAFQEMMQMVQQGKVNCIIVKDLSRLGREYIETGRYIRRVFPAYGVRFIAINDHVDTIDEPADSLTVSVKNIMNKSYSRDISIKTRSALDAKRRNGDFVGAFTIYGYVKSGEKRKRLEIDPIEKHDFDLVQRLRQIDTRTAPQKDTVYLFSGILICGCCGSRMTRKTNRYKDREYHYYYCPTGKKKFCNSSVMLKESDLIQCVQESLKGHIGNVASLDALLSSISQERIN